MNCKMRFQVWRNWPILLIYAFLLFEMYFVVTLRVPLNRITKPFFSISNISFMSSDRVYSSRIGL